MDSKIKTKQDIKIIADKLREQNKKIITTNGVFDILHIGHIESFSQAKKLGDVLVVGINSDKSVRICLTNSGSFGKNKLVERPIVPENERAAMLAALQIVDYVVLFDEPDPRDFLANVKPDIHVKGKDWEGKRIPEMDILEEYGGKIEYISLVPEHSTTNLIKKIVDSYNQS